MAVNAIQNENHRMGNHRDRNGKSDQPHVSNGFSNFGLRSTSARAWIAARTASKMAQAAVFSLFGGTSISIAGPAPSDAATAARGRGAGRHVRVPCPVECPHACVPPRGPAPPPPFLCRGRTLVTRHPRRNSARRVSSAGAGRDADHGAAAARRPTHGRKAVAFHCETAGGKAPNTCRVSRHTCSDGSHVSPVPEQPCCNLSCVDRHLGYIKKLRGWLRAPVEYEAGLAINCHQLVPARGGVNCGSNRVLESLRCTLGRVRCCRAHAWAQCRASTGSIARILGQIAVQSWVLSVNKNGVFTDLGGGFAPPLRTRRYWDPRDVS
jgi:hypothetical protein